MLNRWRYREHELGEVFEATLEPEVERRAIEMKVIELIERKDISLAETQYVPPRGRTLIQT